jgi:preprotein translocase subunit YajC
MKKYFIHVNGSNVGPYSFEDLRSMRIQKTTPVWYDGLGNWRNAGDVAELRALFASNASTFTTSQNYSKPGARSTYNFTDDNLSGNTSANKSGRNAVVIVIAVVILVFAVAGVFIYNQQQKKKRAMEEMMQTLEQYQTDESMDAIVEEAPVPEEIDATDYGTSSYSGRFNNYSGGMLKIIGSDENNLTVNLKLDDAYGCTGEISGTATVVDEKTIQVRTSSGCKIKISYSTGFVMVEEGNGCSSEHGSDCTFDGIYSKEK